MKSSRLERLQVLELSKVRLRLSGALAFAANLVGYVTGFIFTVFITRRLSEEEFGVWALISSLIVYSLTPYNLVSSWISRDAARGRKVFESALVLCAFLIPISIIIYILAGIGSATAINYGFNIILLGLIVLVPYIFLSLGNAIQGGYAPQNVGAARILFEISKVIFALFLVVVLRLGLIGALISLSLAYILQSSLLLYKSRPLSQRRINREWVIKWLKGAPINVIRVLNDILSATNIVLMSVILGHAIIAGYWQAAVSASALATSSKLLTRGLGARLLSGGSQKDVDKAFSFSMMLAVPMLLGFLALSRDLLWVLKPTYSAAWIAACFLALAGLIRAVGNIGATVLSGTDRFDQGDEVTIKNYLRSKIFLLNKLRIALTSFNVISVAIYLVLAKSAGVDIVEIITLISAINLVYSIAGAMINLRLMKKMTSFQISFEILKPYLIASVVMVAVVYALRNMLGPLPARVLEAAPIIISLVAVGALIYGGILYLISKEFREFLREARSFISNYRLTNFL